MANIYGAIIGDIVGSIYEVEELKNLKKQEIDYSRKIKILSPSTPLFTEDCSFTDDSILTCAIANAILDGKKYEKYLKLFGEKEKELGKDKYGRSRFGKGFLSWLDGGPSNSHGNGCAMRISPVGYAFNSLNETLKEAEKATICSHNSQDAISCAKAVAGAIYLARNGKSKDEIKDFCVGELGKIDFDLEKLQREYKFTAKAIESAPEAIYCFLISTSFEDCLRKTISIGGDADTTASISCGIAGAFYPIDKNIISAASSFIPSHYKEILNSFNNKYCSQNTNN